jgi:hypothetical protein
MNSPLLLTRFSNSTTVDQVQQQHQRRDQEQITVAADQPEAATPANTRLRDAFLEAAGAGFAAIDDQRRQHAGCQNRRRYEHQPVRPECTEQRRSQPRTHQAAQSHSTTH